MRRPRETASTRPSLGQGSSSACSPSRDDLNSYDAVVVGSGPNGLAAAITLARAGRSVLLIEAAAIVGGGMRSDPLTLPGFVHDVCSAIHPLGVGSPFFRSVPLVNFGLKWIHPPSPLAHPFDDGTAALLERSIDATGQTIAPDAAPYRKLMAPFVGNWKPLIDELLAPPHLPRCPLLLGRFGWRAIRPSQSLAQRLFAGERARGLFAGLAAHAILPLDALGTSAFSLVLGVLGHAVGWPVAEGGSGRIADAMAQYFRSLHGKIVTGQRVHSLRELPSARVYLFDVAPRVLSRIVGERFSAGYRRRLERFRHGPGAFKLDWALDGPIPWKAQECGRAATVHLGGTLTEIAWAERAVSQGDVPERPFVLVAQQSLFDSSRAPAGQQTAWAYCHVPSGSTFDMTGRIEAQVERFAPGFRDRILRRSTLYPAQLEAYNANYVGGDIGGGANDLWQVFARPMLRLNPYATPVRGIYMCSAATPPGGGVHGMCGYHAARSTLRRELA